MKRLLALLSILIPGSLWAVGQQNALTVSSGTYLGVDLYSNADGANRQAIVLGDRVSSNTLTVDGVLGIPVYLSTSSLTPGAFPIISTKALTVDGSGVTQPVSGTVTASPSGTYAVSVSSIGAAQTAIDTNSGSKSGGTQRIVIATDQPQLTNALKVDGSGVTQPVSGTVGMTGFPLVPTGANASTTTVFALPTGVNASTMAVINQSGGAIAIISSKAITVDGSGVTQPVSGTLSVQNTSGGSIAIVSSNTIPVSGSFSATGSSVTIFAPNNNTTAIPVSGSFSATTVLNSTAAYGAVPPPIGIGIGFTNGTGFSMAKVDASSSVYVIPEAGFAIPIVATAAVPISGSVSASFVSLSTYSFGLAMGSTGTAVGGLGQNGNFEAFHLDASSSVYVTQEAGSAFPILSTNTINVSQQGNVTVVGAAASTATASGNPVLIGGVYNQTQTALTEGQVINELVTQRGSRIVATGVDPFYVKYASNTAIPIVSTGSVATINASGGTLAVTSTTSWTVQGAAANAAAASGNPVQTGVIVSSASLPTPGTANQIMYTVGDPFGRQIVVQGVHVSTYSLANATITNTTLTTLISSAAVNNYRVLCGCKVTNSSATNTRIVVYRTLGGTQDTVDSYPIGAPANYLDTGNWPGCGSPLMRSAAGSGISVQADGSVSSLYVTCGFYTSP